MGFILAGLDSEERLSDFAAELCDRFGELPAEVRNLLAVVGIRNLATSLGIQRISYNRAREWFELRLFEDEGDWHRRAPLIDGRFSSAAQPGSIVLSLPFAGHQTAGDLHDALSGLVAVRASA